MTRIARKDGHLGALGWALTTALTLCLTATSALAAPPRVPGAQTAESAQLRVNLNTADEQALSALPGIGPSKAQAILKLRERMKRFRRIEDVMRVRGVGRKTFRRLKSMLSVEGPSRGLPGKGVVKSKPAEGK